MKDKLIHFWVSERYLHQIENKRPLKGSVYLKIVKIIEFFFFLLE